MAEEKKRIGKVTHYFGKISVAGIELSAKLKVGDTMQIDNNSVTEANPGDLIGIKVKEEARVGDDVYLVS